MRTIFKYPLSHQHTNLVRMPIGAEIVKIDAQHDVVCIWVDCNPDESHVDRLFYSYNTGASIDPKLKHLATVLLNDGYRVVHVFE